jgi:hypothetical protein
MVQIDFEVAKKVNVSCENYYQKKVGEGSNS